MDVVDAISSSSFRSRHSCANCIELLMELHIDSSIVVPVRETEVQYFNSFFLHDKHYLSTLHLNARNAKKKQTLPEIVDPEKHSTVLFDHGMKI